MTHHRNLLTRCGLCGLAIVPLGAWAHPLGVAHAHGFVQGLAHPFGGLDHLLAALGIGLWAAQRGRRALWAVPAGFVIAMVAGAMLAARGVALPQVEAGIAASVLVPGLAIALRGRCPRAPCAALVAIFALCHGYAHGLDAGGSAAPLPYALGFCLSTLALLGTGGLAGSRGARWLEGRVLRAAGLGLGVAGLWLFAAG